MSGAPLTISLGEYDTGWHDPPVSLARAGALVSAAAAAGAHLVVLPEMCPTGFTMESSTFAEPLNGPSVRALGAIAREQGVHLLAGIATARDGACFNSAILLDPAGEIAALYDKQKLFTSAREARSYAAGASPVIFEVAGVRLSVFVCFDLRFPELFRAVAPYVDGIVVTANWPAVRQSHWETLCRARAIENQCYLVAVNRVGAADGVEYQGGSAVYGPWGDELADAARGRTLVKLDPAEVTRVRARYPFVDDARATPSAHGPFAAPIGAGALSAARA
jgi:omega-amidase